MKVLAIANQKGGVGKSTLAVHLAWRAQEQGLRPCLLIWTVKPTVPIPLSSKRAA